MQPYVAIEPLRIIIGGKPKVEEGNKVSCIKTGCWAYLKDYNMYVYGDAHAVGDVMVFNHSTTPVWTATRPEGGDGTLYEISSNPEWYVMQGVFVVPFSQVTYTA